MVGNIAVFNRPPHFYEILEIVAVFSSDKDNRFIAIDFTDPAHPSTVLVNSPFDPGTGCVVDCSGSLAAVGNYQSGSVVIYDLTSPANPTKKKIIDTNLGVVPISTGIGPLSLDGTNLLIGEYNGPNVVLIDISTASIVSTFSDLDFADGGITSIVLKGSYAVVCGKFTAHMLDYTNPANPQVNQFDYLLDKIPGTSLFPKGPYTCAFDGLNVALGDAQGYVYLFQISGGGIQGNVIYQDSGNGVESIAIWGPEFATGGVSDMVSLFNTDPNLPPPAKSKTIFVGSSAGTAGGPLVSQVFNLFGLLPNNVLIAGTRNGSGIYWFNVPYSLDQIPQRIGTAPNALNPGLYCTLGFTVFTFLRRLGPVWLPDWLRKLLGRLFGG